MRERAFRTFMGYLKLYIRVTGRTSESNGGDKALLNYPGATTSSSGRAILRTQCP